MHPNKTSSMNEWIPAFAGMTVFSKKWIGLRVHPTDFGDFYVE